MIFTDLRRYLDPVTLAVDVGLTLDGWQADLLTTMPRRALLLCCRQAGKSTIASLLAIHVAIYEAPALVLCLAPSLRQSGEWFRSTLQFYQKLKDVPALAAESALRAELANGSRICALPGNERTVRGFAAPALIIVDEAARVDDSLFDAVTPMQATNPDGRLIQLSTPAGRRGQFFDAWHGDGDWHRVRVPASECPRISQKFLDDELKAKGPLRFSEEYELAFVDDALAMFGQQLVDKCFDDHTLRAE